MLDKFWDEVGIYIIYLIVFVCLLIIVLKIWLHFEEKKMRNMR